MVLNQWVKINQKKIQNNFVFSNLLFILDITNDEIYEKN